MNLSFHTNHRLLVLLIFAGFTTLSIGIAILPAYDVQEKNQHLPGASLSSDAQIKGKAVYISEGCVACHTQQVRNISIDKTWGGRPGIPADYADNTRPDVWRQTASILGTERTGPDLTNVGRRQPSIDWHLLHLYNPRIVVSESIMPGYPWLFEEKENPTQNDRIVNLPPEIQNNIKGHLVTTESAENLVAYLLSLQQDELPSGIKIDFIDFPKKSNANRPPDQVGGTKTTMDNKTENDKILNVETMLASGQKLFQIRCAPCHQVDGQGLSGAFPPLKGSEIVNDQDANKMISIILHGYDENNEFGAMPGFAAQLSDEEIAAIASYERNSWGNTGEMVTAEEVKTLREMLKPPLQ